jgi:hypothetical protein
MKMYKYHKKIISAFAIIALTVFGLSTTPATVDAAQDWLVELRAVIPNDSQVITFGEMSTARERWNPGDSEAIIAGKIEAYFYHPEWRRSTPYFWGDIKPVSSSADWSFFVKTSSYYTNLYWDTSSVPSNVILTITDTVTGTIINMRELDTYQYTRSSTSPREFTISATE